MAWTIVFGAISAIGSAYYLWRDHEISKDMADSTSQFGAYIELLQGQMSLEEFLDAAWPSLVLIGLVLFLGFIIATPQRRRRRI